MMDWCDKDAPEGALDDLWDLIRNTPMLDWQLLTKRATLIENGLPNDWGHGYSNVWLGVTVEDMAYGYPRAKALKKIPAVVRFISAEPLLEPLKNAADILDGIQWIIIGGESGANYRPMKSSWAVDLAGEAQSKGIAVWFKQHGGNGRDKGGCKLDSYELKQWPNDLQGDS